MAKKDNCQLYDHIDGKNSRLHKDLIKLTNRPIGNMLYAMYKVSPTIAQDMTNAGYKLNIQGQHKAEDFLLHIKWGDIESEVRQLHTIEKTYGFVDTNGNRVDFINAEDALKKADDFNNNHKGIIANVYKNGDVYHIIAVEKNSNTISRFLEVKDRLQIWDMYKQKLGQAGVDLNNIPAELQSMFSAYNSELIENLQSLKRMPMDYMYKKHALALFYLYQNSIPVQRVIRSFGSMEAAAQAVEDLNHGHVNMSNGQNTLLNRAVAYCQQFNGLDLNTIQNNVSQIRSDLRSNSFEHSITEELNALNKKYHINKSDIHLYNKDLTALSDVTAHVAIQLQREIREIERKRGKVEDSKKLDIMLNQIMRELKNKRYCSGIYNYLKEATANIEQTNDILSKISLTGTDLEQAMEAARRIQAIEDIYKKYYTTVEALASDHLAIDESIDQTDIDNIKTKAKELKQIFDNVHKQLYDPANPVYKLAVENIVRKILGDRAADGISIKNTMEMVTRDSSIMDYLYSIGRLSDPVANSIGTIIRNAQESRESIVNAFSQRMRIATSKLYKSGSNSKFMYEDDGHIISDIDWKAYREAKKQFINSLRGLGLDKFQFRQEIEDWVDANTEDREVDTLNHRTERVPNSNYRKQFPQLTKAQLEYYNEMMQIKGEIGSLLPVYAQMQYRPPQLRREMLDAIGEAKSAKDVVKALKNKIKDVYTIREDDTDFSENSIVVDEIEYERAEGDYDDTLLKNIPIFYVNHVEKGELLKDFTGGLAALMGTAVNYKAMSDVEDVVLLMRDFIAQKDKGFNQPKADAVENEFINVTKDLKKKEKASNTLGIVDAAIDQYLYGNKLDPEQFGYKWAKAVTGLIGYTSFKGLATNVVGAVNNYLIGELQMFIEAGGGEFYKMKDLLWAHSKLFGEAGVGGEIMELFTNNMNHKATLFREKFNPLQENYSDKTHERYYTSWFRQALGHDFSFLGYASGEYLIHYVNMYAVLHNEKVKLNGKEISLFDAFEVKALDGNNSELVLKQGVTMLDGVSPITEEYLQEIKNKIQYVNQTTHGSMNEEDKGMIHRKLLGRAAMNFRQWMVEHYSRRFRAGHSDYSLKTPTGVNAQREGYWVSVWKHLFNEDTKESWQEGMKKDALLRFMKDFTTFIIRAESQWDTLTDLQKYNVKRAHTELMLYVALACASVALGEPDEHKKEWWRRFFIYQVKRMMVDTEASMPTFRTPQSILTILQSPMAAVNTLNSLFYIVIGLGNGDLIGEDNKIKSGPHKGENRYWRNVKKYSLPFFKDFERLQNLGNDEALFKVFDYTPSSR